MKTDLISVIIPTYSRNDSLEKAIISVENQTYKNIEIIVVDDNNPGTEYRVKNENRMKDLCKQYKNIRYIKHEKNKNGAAARNTGIKNSRGHYVAFLDDDDEFFPNKIEIQYKFLKENPQYKCVGCGCIKGDRIVENPYYGDISKEILTLKYSFTTSIFLFDKDVLLRIGMFDERFVRHQDYELLLKYCKKYKIGKMNQALVKKGINKGENRPKGKKAEYTKKLFLESFMDRIESIDKKEYGFKRKVLFYNYFQLFLVGIKSHDLAISIKYALKALANKPLLFIPSLFNVFMKKIRGEHKDSKIVAMNNIGAQK